jgi:hypothetical protein
MLLSFTKDAMAVLGDRKVVKELNVHCTKMTMEDAILLFYIGNYTEAQWDSMALAVNKLMKPGFDFEQHMVNVLGPRLRKPLSKYHDAHVEAVFKRQDEIWAAEPLVTGLRELERDAEVAAFVENLQAVFKALSVVHKQINQPKADLETLQAAEDAFASNVRIFEWDKTPAPFRYRLKLYDHAIMDHVVEVTRHLQEQGL